jgi:hypothetical protein
LSWGNSIGTVAVDIAARHTYPDPANQGGILSFTNISFRSFSSDDNLEVPLSTITEEKQDEVHDL